MHLVLIFLSLFLSSCLSRDIPVPEAKPDTMTENLSVCETGWEDNGEYCYKVYNNNDGLYWTTAAMYCAGLGGRLASIHSEQENAFLTDLLITESQAFTWIGLQDIMDESDFWWEDGSRLSDYQNWATGEPSGDMFGDEDCVGLSYEPSISRIGSWNDAKCDESHAFICQKRKGAPNPIPSSTTQLTVTTDSLDSFTMNPAGTSTKNTLHTEVNTYKDLSSLLDASEDISIGSLAFLTDDQSLLIRVKKGWKYIQMSKLVHLRAPNNIVFRVQETDEISLGKGRKVVDNISISKTFEQDKSIIRDDTKVEETFIEEQMNKSDDMSGDYDSLYTMSISKYEKQAEDIENYLEALEDTP